MNKQPILIIVNPLAGKDEPVLELIGKVFADGGPEITVHVLEEGEDAVPVIRSSDAGIIAVYGGDGSVTAAAEALIGTSRPMAIVPGGTANVLAKELGIPQDTEAALTLLRDGLYALKTIDTGLVNERPFLLRVNLGIMADMITGTDPELKGKLGQLAYGVATLKSAREAEPVPYRLNIDGQEINESGVALTVTNSGSMGIGGLQLQPGILVNDGLLDVVLLRDADFLSVMKAAGSTLLGWETEVIKHWACKEVNISLSEKQTYLCDDCQAEGSEIHIRVVPGALNVIAPDVE